MMKVLVLFLVTYIHHISACTEFIVECKDKHESVIIGRTMEFAVNAPWKVVSAPKGKLMKAQLPPSCSKAKPKTWISGYKSLYIVGDTTEIEDAHNLWLDGQNNAGLSVGALYFEGYAWYPTDVPKMKCGNVISHTQMVNYLLTNYATVKEVQQALDEDTFPMVWSRALIVQGSDYTFPIHWSIVDKSGDAIVLEYTAKEGRRVFTNEVGVFTNNPTYDWHTTNLNNYINLQKGGFENKTYVRNGKEYNITAFGHGSGLLGVPGDFTPPGRFIRTAAMVRFSGDAANPTEGALKAWHIINSVDITDGASGYHGGMTCWAVVKDLQNNIMYYRGQNFIGIRKVELNKTSKKETQAITLGDTFLASVEDVTNMMEDFQSSKDEL